MNKHFAVVVVVVIVFLGFLLGYSVPPFIHSGVFSEREEKGVEVKIDKEMEQYYKDLYTEEEE